MTNRPHGIRNYRPALLLGGMVALVLLLGFAISRSNRTTRANALPALEQVESGYFLPVITQRKPPPICRFGVNILEDSTLLDFASLRMGWYLDYRADPAPDKPGGADYVPIIRLNQIGSDDYSYSPSGAVLQAAIAGNPGAAWIIGNEPDRVDYQDDMLPHLYARAYEELYYLIKSADPTARIFAGAIVQPTPIRLQYLDMVLQSYEAQFGQPMPVDGWSIHNFILNEVSCDEQCDPLNCWGAEIPPGINACYGEVLTIDDNDDADLFIKRIEDFRQWMADRGYGGLPVYLSEFGVQMPVDFGFPPTRVNAFMNDTFTYMMSATDPLIGDPNDDYRLIQKWAWYSSTDQNFNGALYDPTNGYAITQIGNNFATYASSLSADVDLYPNLITTTVPASVTNRMPMTLTLSARVANSGNGVQLTDNVTVRLFNGDPENGGTQIGTDQVTALHGCGDNDIVHVTWKNVSPGTYQIFVSVDPGNYIIESDEENNTIESTILVNS